MCGRFTFTRGEVDALARELSAEVERAGADDEPALGRPRFNVAPSQRHWILRLLGGRRLLSAARFGMARARGGLHVNARSESAARSRAFSRAFAGARCVVPTDGFYEWRRGDGGPRPFFIHRPERGLLLMAGLWEEGGARPPAGAAGRTSDLDSPEPGGDEATRLSPEPRGRTPDLDSPGLAFTILTIASSAEVSALHDRMPVLLDREGAERWLALGDPALLVPAPAGWLAIDPASPLVNSVANDGPALLLPPPPEAQLGFAFDRR